jgi:hypothetical protein
VFNELGASEQVSLGPRSVGLSGVCSISICSCGGNRDRIRGDEGLIAHDDVVELENFATQPVMLTEIRSHKPND